MELLGRMFSVVDNVVTFVVNDPKELEHISRVTSEMYPEATLHIPDGRKISRVQRAKAHAIMRDIAKFQETTLESVKQDMKLMFCDSNGIEYFSFSNVDMTTARDFITYLLETCFEMDIPLAKGGLELQDDIEKYQYICLAHRKCVLCQKPAEVHHLDRVGSGMRHLVDHRKLRLVALCHVHHQVAQKMSMEVFEKEYHLPGIRLDEQTLHDLGIMTYARMAEIDRRKERDEFNH